MRIRIVLLTMLLTFFVAGCNDNQVNSTESPEDTTHSSTKEESSNVKGNKQIVDSITNESNEESSSVKSELKISEPEVKLPTAFPEREVKPFIEKNEGNKYTISYSKEAEEVATFSGTQYASTEEAIQTVQNFSNGKKVGPFDEGAVDLGHGITGYGEGATGSQYFSWEEGNWLLSIRSLTMDEMDHPEIAKKIVEYLETHMLPAPGEDGIVYINYPQGGNEVSVDVRWQENNMVYRLQTARVPLEALEMSASVT